MSTFDYLTPDEAVAAAQDSAPEYKRITGLKGVDADRIPNVIPEEPWRAHGHLDKFKEIARVEWAQDADPGTAEVFYTDGTTDLIKRDELLCVERPITGPTPRRVESSSQDTASETAYDGQNWATHSVAVWIENDGSFIDTARSYARFDETGEKLAEYIGRLLFDRTALAYEERRRLTADDVHTLSLVADDLTQEGDDTPAREALKRVNWKYIAAQLTDEQ